MNISADRIRTMLITALERGYSSCAELKSQDIIDLMKEFDIPQDDGWRIWTVEELSSLPDGSIFEHSSLGRAWINAKSMQFVCGRQAVFVYNTSPFNEPMRLVYCDIH